MSEVRCQKPDYLLSVLCSLSPVFCHSNRERPTGTESTHFIWGQDRDSSPVTRDPSDERRIVWVTAECCINGFRRVTWIQKYTKHK